MPDSSNDLTIRLPAELSNRIYGLVLPIDQTIHIRGREIPPGIPRYPPVPLKQLLAWREPGLLSVSKQVRKECSSMYYHGFNHFQIFARQ